MNKLRSSNRMKTKNRDFSDATIFPSTPNTFGNLAVYNKSLTCVNGRTCVQRVQRVTRELHNSILLNDAVVMTAMTNDLVVLK